MTQRISALCASPSKRGDRVSIASASPLAYCCAGPLTVFGWGTSAMFRMIAVCSILIFSAASSGLAQTAAHRAAHNQMHPPAAASSSGGLAADQFATESAAKAHCPGDTIVWANLGGSKAYHMSGNKYFGKTKHGAYMCQKDADQAGFHPAGRRAAKTAHTTSGK